MIKGWEKLEDFFNDGEFKNLYDKVMNNRNKFNVFPSDNEIFNAFKYTSLDNTKVVIIGQDPYYSRAKNGHPYANGLAFSVSPDARPLPKTLVNIFKELNDDLGIGRTNGDLTDWAKQGVLLLNASLSVIENFPNSHSKYGWDRLLTETLVTINDNKEDVVFILWGNNALSYARLINDNKHFIITSAHPSSLSAYRGFFGSKPFSRTNEFLLSKGKEIIRW